MTNETRKSLEDVGLDSNFFADPSDDGTTDIQAPSPEVPVAQPASAERSADAGGAQPPSVEAVSEPLADVAVNELPELREPAKSLAEFEEGYKRIRPKLDGGDDRTFFDAFFDFAKKAKEGNVDKSEENAVKSLLLSRIKSLSTAVDENTANWISQSFSISQEEVRKDLENNSKFSFYGKAGGLFDPSIHDAAPAIEVNDPNDDMRVMEVVRPGLRYEGRGRIKAFVALGYFGAIRGELKEADGTPIPYEIKHGTEIEITTGGQPQVQRVRDVYAKDGLAVIIFDLKKGEENPPPQTVEEWKKEWEKLHKAKMLTIKNPDPADKKEVIDPDDSEIRKISEALDLILADTPEVGSRKRRKIIDEQIVPNGEQAVNAIFANPMLESFLRLKESEGGNIYREALIGRKLIPNYITMVMSEILEKVIANEQGLRPYIQEQLRAYLKDGHDSSAAKELLIDLGSEDKELMQSALNDTDPDCAACAIRALKEGESRDVIGAMERFASSNHPYALNLFSTAYGYFIKDFKNLNDETLSQIFLLSVQYFSNCRSNLLSAGISTKNTADKTLENLANLARLAGKTIGSSTIKRIIDVSSGDPIALLKQDLGLS